MVAKIEDQIHERRLEEYEKYLKDLEKKLGKKPPRYKIKKWTRFGPEGLCQEKLYLKYISEYDYDLSDEKFQNYCLSRGVLHYAGEKGSLRWDFFLNYGKTKNEYLCEPYFQYAQEVNGKRYQYTRSEMKTGWKIILTGRGAFQDCWELYSQKTDQE